MSEDELVKAAAEGAAKGLSEKIPPLYTDLLQPSVKEIGNSLAAIIKMALAPVAVAVWGYKEIADWLNPDLENRMKEIAPENIVPPKLSIIGPAIESLKFLANEPNLREMFAQLIANSLDKATAESVHP